VVPRSPSSVYAPAFYRAALTGRHFSYPMTRTRAPPAGLHPHDLLRMFGTLLLVEGERKGEESDGDTYPATAHFRV
jgi:hypothetical protein